MFYQRNDIPSPDFLSRKQISNRKIQRLFSFLSKKRTGGMMEKVKLGHPNKIDHAFEVPSVLERLVDFDKEISVIVARNRKW